MLVPIRTAGRAVTTPLPSPHEGVAPPTSPRRHLPGTPTAAFTQRSALTSCSRVRARQVTSSHYARISQ